MSNPADPTPERGAVYSAMCAFFDADEWQYQPIEGQAAIHIGFQGENGIWRCVAQAREEQRQFLFYSILDEAVAPARRALADEFLTRANYGMVIGNFEMDHQDGEVRFKTSVDFTEQPDPILPEVIGHYAYLNVLMMDRYLPALENVLAGRVAPQAAVDGVVATE